MKLLLAHDGSPHANAAIADLPRCGLPGKGQAVVLTVADAWQTGAADAQGAGGVMPEALSAAIEKAREIADAGRQLAMAHLPGWSVVAEHVPGSPAWEVIRKTDEWVPDLVVVGETSTGRVERIVFGTTTNQVVSHAHCSVRVSRPRPDASGPARLVLGSDGSAPSLAAARAVAARSWATGSEVRIVVVLDGWLMASLDPKSGTGGRERAREIVATTRAALDGSGLTVSDVTLEGDPKTILSAEAMGWNADCIFMGPKGRSGVQRLLLGSVAMATASRAGCSVEIVRTGVGKNQ